MRVAKATLRQSNKHMVTINVPFHLTAHDLLQILVLHSPTVPDSKGVSNNRDWEKANVIDTVKWEIQGNGYERHDVYDYTSAEDVPDAVAWARRQIERVWNFPTKELDDAATSIV